MPDVIIQRYVTGESLKTLAGELGISRETVKANLIRTGIKLRTASQAQELVWLKRTKEERIKQVKAAHNSPNRKPPPIQTRPLEERFWGKVRKTETCWFWEGSRCKAINNWGNYGRISVNGKTELAHRISWILAHGAIPDGLLVLHRCDNPPCVNPDHLFLGTAHDNNSDMSTKGRSTQGTKNKNAILNNDDVVIIRECYANGQSINMLRQKYNVSAHTISRIIHRKTWQHI